MNTLIENEPYKVIGSVVHVCGECFPGSTITGYFPDLAGFKISHSMCPAHLERFRVTARALKAALGK